MNNITILPIIIPLMAGILMALFRKKIIFHRVTGILAFMAMGVTAAVLISQNANGGIQTLHIGGWEAPFGISIVVDMFSALLLMATSIVGLMCMIYAFYTIGKPREEHYFYPFFLFLITGVNGSFITGDLFNLFVCFEVMLVASYGLITLGGTKPQLRESIKYILINVISSMLFLVAIAYLYGMTGTVNMAHLSLRVAELGQDGLMTTVSLLFMIVFSLKAALFLFFWLPGSYSAPPTAVAAVFAALLTKVGIYAMFRVYTLIFYHEPGITHMILAIMAALTMILGGFGAVAYWDIKKILTYNVVIGVGFIVSGLAALNQAALVGAIYYLIHDILIKALIFLIGGTMIALTGTSKLREMSGLIRNHPYLGWMFFIAALSLSGIPPLSGFVGKIFITQGTFDAQLFWLGGIGLFTSLMVLYSIMKIFMNGFWGETLLSVEEEKSTTKGVIVPIACLTILTVVLGIGAEGLHGYVEQAVTELMNPQLYIDAVFGGDAGASANTD